jgi:DNA polymerase III delta subunit
MPVPRPVTAADVTELAVPSGEQEIWALTNYLAAGRREDALRYAQRLLERGEDAFSLWNILLWMLRTLTTVTAAVQAGERQPAQIASLYRVPFPTAKNLLPLASRLSLPSLRALVEWGAAADVQLKTGGYRATQEAPQELTALIDRFILLCTEEAMVR